MVQDGVDMAQDMDMVVQVLEAQDAVMAQGMVMAVGEVMVQDLEDGEGMVQAGVVQDISSPKYHKKM